jgi:hypothetical protein
VDAARDEPATVSQRFVIGWNIFRITVWIMIAVWANPHFLDYVGGEGIARWLLHHRWLLLAAPPLGLLGLLSVFEVAQHAAAAPRTTSSRARWAPPSWRSRHRSHLRPSRRAWPSRSAWTMVDGGGHMEE